MRVLMERWGRETAEYLASYQEAGGAPAPPELIEEQRESPPQLDQLLSSSGLGIKPLSFERKFSHGRELFVSPLKEATSPSDE